ncbi:unnamed protein product [Orchesella dallaii]|uniref:Uncharacterized protein n=1 Tax=Orchesella dallaii TaxID=48710 RepID=A0ABP1PQA9_9HEXA
MDKLQKGYFITSVTLVSLLLGGTLALSSHDSSGVDSTSYEVIGMGAHSSHDNSHAHAAIISHTRQRRSPHIPSYHGGYHHRPHHHGHGYYHGGGGPSSSFTNSHSQAHAVSAQFGGKDWGAGFSGSAVSAGSGANNQHHYGYRRK